MTQAIGSTEARVETLSPDGHFYWDGVQWISTLSPDGAWRWNGSSWAPEPKLARPYESTRTLGIGVCIMLAVSGAIAIVEALFVNDTLMFWGMFGDFRASYSISVGAFAMFAVTSALYLLWFHRSHRNLAALGAKDLNFSPASAVGWWFVPVAGLWKPFQAALEIWKFSTMSSGAGGSILIRAWWASWLACLLALNFAAIVVGDSSYITWPSALSAHATVVAAVLAIFVVNSVSAGQEARWRHIVGGENQPAVR